MAELGNLGGPSRARPVGALRRLRGFLPEGRSLPVDVWRRRHHAIVVLLALHVPAIFVFAMARGYGAAHSLQEAAIVGSFGVAAGLVRRGRKLRAVLATVGLLTSSAVLVHVSGGTIEAHFHFFVMVGVIALYQDWTPFLVAVGYVLLHHGVAGVMDPASVYNHPAAIADPWTWAGIHALFVAGACAVALLAWRLNEEMRGKAEGYYRQLYEGEHALVQRLEEAQRMKDDLVATISHEFRTPITAILGMGRTMLVKGDDLNEDLRRDFTERSVRQAERLRRIVENLLEASRIVEPDRTASTGVEHTVAEVMQELNDLPESAGVVVRPSIALGLRARVTDDALHMIIGNLVGNALKFAPAGTDVDVVAEAAPGERVSISVSNVAPELDPDEVERIFEPFVQLDSSWTRPSSGVGLGLHIVRRLAEVHGGSVEARSGRGRISFVVHLPAAAPASVEREPA